MAKHNDLIHDDEINDSFILDSTRQLKSGLSIYLFTERQVELIKDIMYRNYKIILEIIYDGFCYQVSPSNKVYKHLNY